MDRTRTLSTFPMKGGQLERDTFEEAVACLASQGSSYRIRNDRPHPQWGPFSRLLGWLSWKHITVLEIGIICLNLIPWQDLIGWKLNWCRLRSLAWAWTTGSVCVCHPLYKSELRLSRSVLEHQLSNAQSRPVTDLHHLQHEDRPSATASDPGSLSHTRWAVYKHWKFLAIDLKAWGRGFSSPSPT